jgi:pyruvate dehydrogenase E1 component beta subunit
MLMAAVQDDNPVVFIEHRWLHSLNGPVPEGAYQVPLGKARVVREGEHITLVGVSYMTIECLRAAKALEAQGARAEVIDLRSLNPLDDRPILESVRKTGRLVVADTSWANAGMSAEIIARVSEKALLSLRCPPRRVTLPPCPSPTTAALARHFYPRARDIMATAMEMLDMSNEVPAFEDGNQPLDVPDLSFAGPF